MAKVKVVLNRSGVRSLMKSEEMMREEGRKEERENMLREKQRADSAEQRVKDLERQIAELKKQLTGESA